MEMFQSRIKKYIYSTFDCKDDTGPSFVDPVARGALDRWLVHAEGRADDTQGGRISGIGCRNDKPGKGEEIQII